LDVIWNGAWRVSISTHFRPEPEKMTRYRKVSKGEELVPLRSGQVAFDGPGGDLGPRTEPQLAEYPTNVVAGRALGDA
jgi:hypothetical protein